ncbi:MAG: TVP38/TMEM64 family protein [Micropepsaceae bacterium]
MTDTPPPEKTSALARLVPLLVLVLALGAFFATGLNKYFTLDTLKENRAVLKELVHDHKPEAVGIFIVTYIVVAAASLPVGAILSITSGFLFGNVFGTAWIVAGATVGSTILFVIARSALGEPLKRRFSAQIKPMEDGFRRNAFSYMMILRLVPLFPFWLVNLAPAFLGVSLSTFFITTAIGIIPGAFVFASIGNGLNALFEAGEQPDLSLMALLSRPDFYIPIGGLILLSLIPIIYRGISGKSSGNG